MSALRMVALLTLFLHDFFLCALNHIFSLFSLGFIFFFFFFVTGIGIDDMFILVSSWRYTSFKLSTEERLGQTLKDAAVSITITSVTDALAFGVGE